MLYRPLVFEQQQHLKVFHYNKDQDICVQNDVLLNATFKSIPLQQGSRQIACRAKFFLVVI